MPADTFFQSPSYDYRKLSNIPVLPPPHSNSCRAEEGAVVVHEKGEEEERSQKEAQKSGKLLHKIAHGWLSAVNYTFVTKYKMDQKY